MFFLLKANFKSIQMNHWICNISVSLKCDGNCLLTDSVLIDSS